MNPLDIPSSDVKHFATFKELIEARLKESEYILTISADPATNDRVFFRLLDERDFYDQLLIDFNYYEAKLDKNLKGEL